MLCGIDTRNARRRWVCVLSFTYNIAFLALFSVESYCFIANFRYWAPLITLSAYVVHLIMWWLIQLRMKDILALTDLLNSLIDEMDYSTYKRLLKTSKVVRFFVIFLVTFDSILRSMQEVIFKHGYKLCPFKFWYPNMGNTVLIPIVLNKLEYTYIVYAIAYSFAAYYIFYLYILSICLRERQRSKTQLWDLYRNVLNIFKRIEGTLSFLVIFLFLHIFYTFFKGLLFILYAVRALSLPPPYIHCFDLVINTALVIALLFSAEHVQQKADNLRVSLIACTTEVNVQIKLQEDRKRLQLQLKILLVFKYPDRSSFRCGVVSEKGYSQIFSFPLSLVCAEYDHYEKDNINSEVEDDK
ncbi:uncharacterized protein TNIN_177711 [Trichonephila inaurata madagascariensis]|uniref:Uncharacterized protein n=1 Tax=Trichonephila inaurata madagascariensis TaxID=2747483 RepID=A0A8X7BYV4_9ARAC|nr:uncharacterized protein TNIN_177711 [Trichonephila inaurata madagascariensis]